MCAILQLVSAPSNPKAYIVFARAIAKSGFCKFIGNFFAPVSPISFGEFF